MMAPEISRFIKKEIEKYLQIFFNGRTENSLGPTEGVSNLLPGMDVIPDRPVMRPFGLTSRAPDNTGSTVARTGNHPWGLLVLGHLDQNAPLPGPGETVLYNANGNKISLRSGDIFIETSTGSTILMNNSSIVITRGGSTVTLQDDKITLSGTNVTIDGSGDVKIGSDGADEPAVLGNVIKTLFMDLFMWLQTHTHLVAALPGPAPIPTLPPTEAAALTAIQASNIDNDAILSDHIFVEK